MTINLYQDQEDLIESVLNRPFQELFSALVLDVNNPPSSPSTNDVLKFDGTKLVFGAGGGGGGPIGGLSDVVITSPAVGQVLKYDASTNWINAFVTQADVVNLVADLATINTNISNLTSPQYVTLAISSSLSNERVLTTGGDVHLVLTDGGAGNNVSLALVNVAFTDAPNTFLGTITVEFAGVNSILIGNNTIEAAPRFFLSNTGDMAWSDGAVGPDTYLTRNGPTSLSIGPDILVAGNLSFGTSLATGIVKHTNGSGLLSIAIGSDLPSHNHAASDITSGIIATARLGSGTADSTTFLRGDSTWASIGGGTFANLTTNNTWYSGTTQTFQTTVSAKGTAFIYTEVAGEANPLFTISYAGQLNWGGGGASALDIYLYRYTNNALLLSGALYLQGDLVLSGSLATGLLKHTNGSGGLTIATGSDLPSHTHDAGDITSGTIDTARLGSGTADNTTFLRGDNTWVVGGAPSTATYITQTPDGGLSSEQALSALATGILKSTTGTGVLSIAIGADLPSHTHAQSDITNLVSDLANKAALIGSQNWGVGVGGWTQTFLTAIGSIGNDFIQSQVSTESYRRFGISFEGGIVWGAGSGVPDTALTRTGVATLNVSAHLVVSSSLTVAGVAVSTVGHTHIAADVSGVGVLASNNIWAYNTLQQYVASSAPNSTNVWANSIVNGEANERWSIDYDGKMQWGAGGASAVDTYLYRDSAGSLTINGALVAGASLTAGTFIYAPYVNGAYAQVQIVDLISIANPTAPASNHIQIYGKSIAGRMLPKWMGPSGVDTSFQPALFGNRIVMFMPSTGTTGTGSGTSIGPAWTSNGTVNHPTPATTSPAISNQMKRTRYVNVVTTTNQQLGPRFNAASEQQFWRGNAAGLGGFFFVARFIVELYPASTVRIFAGLASTNTGSVVISDTVINNVCGLWHDATDPSSGANSFNFVTRDTSTTTKASIALSNAIAAGNSYDFYMFCAPNGSTIYYRLDDIVNSVTYEGSTSTTLPANTAFMQPQVQMSNGTANVTATTVGIGVCGIYVESDH